VQIVCEIAGRVELCAYTSIVHRDVKPGNVLLEEGHAVLSDLALRARSEDCRSKYAHLDGSCLRHSAVHEPGASLGRA
jgi:serine/threonine protein kinase